MGGSSTSKLLFHLLVVTVAVAVAPIYCARVGPPFASYQKPLHPDQMVAASLRSMSPPPAPTGNLMRNFHPLPSMMGGSSTRLLLALLFVLVMAMAPSVCARVGPPLATYRKPMPLDQLVVGGFRSSLRRSRGQQPPPPTGNLPRFPSPPPPQPPPPPPPPPPPETSCKEQLP